LLEPSIFSPWRSPEQPISEIDPEATASGVFNAAHVNANIEQHSEINCIRGLRVR
jgi:hypothetical protein